MQSNHPFFLLFLFQLLLQYSTSQYSQCINTKGTETITTKCKCGDFVCKIGKICRAYQSNSNQTAFSCESASHADLFTLASSNYCGSTVATFVPTKQDCEWSARHQFKFNKFTASDPEDRKFATMNIKPPGTVIKPPGCYYDRTNRELWYNKDKTSTTTCTSNQPCICKYKCSPGSYSPITDCGRSYGFRTDVHQPCYSCLQCPIYTFQDTMGASYCKECFDCPAGKYSNAKGQSNCTCLDCQPGKYNSKVGQSSCALCLPGTYHVLFGQTTSKACELCRAGFYSDINGATSCKICPIDTISKDPAATMPSKPTNDDDNNKNLLNANINDCTWCPLKSFNISSTTSTSTSSNHTYQLQTFSASRDVNQLKDIRDRCAFLPADLCNATMRPYLLQNLTTSPGCLHHHQDQLCTRKLCENEKYYHSDSTSLLDRKYLDWKPDACNTFHQIQPWKNKTITSTLPWNTGKFTSNYTCKPCRGEHCYYGYCDQVGYRVETGCHDCIQGYYKYDFNLWNVCEPCNDDNYDGLIEDVFISIFSIYVLLALLYMSLRSEAISYSTLNNNKNMKRKYGVSYQIQSPIGVVLPMLHQIHITALIIVIVTPPKYPWIGSLTRFTVNVLTFDLSSFYTSIQCASNITVRDRFLMSLSTPLLTVVVFGLWWMFANVWIRLTRTKKDKMTLALVAIRRIILRSFAITFFVGVYQPVVKTALSIFDCDIKDWTWTALDGSACPFAPSAESTFNWQGLPSSPFPYPTNHNNDMYGVIGLLTLIFYGLVPFVSISIYVLKHLSNHRTENILDVNKTPKVALDMFDWVLHPYRKNKNWWDIFIGVYKLLILSMLSATLMVAGSRFLIILFMVTLSIILHLWNRPYRSSAMTVIWVLFDMTHVLGLMASVITETDKGFEFDIDFGETIHTATSPSPLSTSSTSSSSSSSSSSSLSPSTSLMDDTSTTGERLLRSLAQGGGKVARQSADSNLFTNDIFDPMGCFNATTLESNCHNKLPNVVSYMYMMSILIVLTCCFIVMVKSILTSMEEQRRNEDELSVAKGGTYVVKKSNFSNCEKIFLAPIVIVFSILIILSIPFFVISFLIEIVIRLHHPCFNTPCWLYDIGNLWHVAVLDDFRILFFAPLYSVLFALRRTMCKRIACCCTDHCLKNKEFHVYEMMYKQSWSKKIMYEDNVNSQVRSDKIDKLRLEYAKLWVRAMNGAGRVYYYSKANNKIRKWKVPKMSTQEEKVRAFYTQVEYDVIAEKLGGKASWKALSWKQRLQELQKERKEIERRKRRPKPPPAPPSTKVVPIKETEEDKTNRFLAFIAKGRKKAEKKKAKKKKEKKKLKKKEKQAVIDAAAERKRLFPQEDDY